MHLQRNEEEHLIVISGLYRVALEDRVFDMSPGTSITIPKGARHSWRNLNSEPSHLLVILTPGGFERCIQTIRNYPPEKLEEVAASFGCYIVGSPVSLACSPRSLQQLVFGPILDEVRQFSTHQPQDDITLIVAKCKGNQNRSRLCAESGFAIRSPCKRPRNNKTGCGKNRSRVTAEYLLMFAHSLKSTVLVS
jgi:hypothetical protein